MEKPPEHIDLAGLRAAVVRELNEGILPYWTAHTLDELHGGFIGRITHDGRVVADAPKGAILNTRILWAFAAAGALGRQDLGRIAERAYRYLEAHFWDVEHGGIYWMVDHLGKPLETKKQVYAQAFAIYGLAEYYLLTGLQPALDRAVQLFELIETHALDPEQGGYLEAFDRSWGPLADVRLSAKDDNAQKTTNTNLHVLEAYTTLYRAWPDPTLRRRLAALVECFPVKIVDARTGHLGLFFDEDWNPRSATVSFGHDIEASWLLVEAAEALGDAALYERVKAAALRIARAVHARGRAPDGSLYYEAHGDGRLDDDRHWWPQAEAVVGFLNAYQLSGEAPFLEAAVRAWQYVERHLIDRANGEWYFRVARDGSPYAGEDKVGPWKAPYHNARMCMEVMRRVGVGA